MPDKDKIYNRTVCGFCPSKTQCDSLREGVHCGDCPETISCAMHGEPGLSDCGHAKEKWGSASLPCKCMLASQVLENPPEGSLVFKTPKSASNTEGPPIQVECPRCSCGTSVITTKYGVSFHIGRPMAMTTTRDIKCAVCALDVEETFE